MSSRPNGITHRMAEAEGRRTLERLSAFNAGSGGGESSAPLLARKAMQRRWENYYDDDDDDEGGPGTEEVGGRRGLPCLNLFSPPMLTTLVACACVSPFIAAH